MKHRLSIKTVNQPAATERVLRLIRHRGFELCAMQLMEQGDNLLNLEVEVRSERPVEQLQQQLFNLFDIQQVRIVNDSVLTRMA